MDAREKSVVALEKRILKERTARGQRLDQYC
jgi:hypothetical protein